MARLGSTGRALRIASAAQDAGVGAGGGALAGHRHGREHGDLQPGRCGDPEAVAGEGSGLAASSSSGQTRDFRRESRTTTANTGPSPEAGIRARRWPANLYRRLAREQTVFEALIGIAAYPDAVAIAVDASPAEQVSLQYVSSNFFQGLGVLPVIGRPFRDEEDRVGQEPVVIVSHRFWMSRLGGGSAALDRSVRINNVPARIVGVAPPGFFGLRAGQWPDIYAPLAMKVAFQPSQSDGAPRGENDRNWWVRQVGRLKPGVPEAAARAQIAGLFRNMVVPEGAR